MLTEIPSDNVRLCELTDEQWKVLSKLIIGVGSGAMEARKVHDWFRVGRAVEGVRGIRDPQQYSGGPASSWP